MCSRCRGACDAASQFCRFCGALLGTAETSSRPTPPAPPPAVTQPRAPARGARRARSPAARVVTVARTSTHRRQRRASCTAGSRRLLPLRLCHLPPIPTRRSPDRTTCSRARPPRHHRQGRRRGGKLCGRGDARHRPPRGGRRRGRGSLPLAAPRAPGAPRQPLLPARPRLDERPLPPPSRFALGRRGFERPRLPRPLLTKPTTCPEVGRAAYQGT